VTSEKAKDQEEKAQDKFAAGSFPHILSSPWLQTKEEEEEARSLRAPTPGRPLSACQDGGPLRNSLHVHTRTLSPFSSLADQLAFRI